MAWDEMVTHDDIFFLREKVTGSQNHSCLASTRGRIGIHQPPQPTLPKTLKNSPLLAVLPATSKLTRVV